MVWGQQGPAQAAGCVCLGMPRSWSSRRPGVDLLVRDWVGWGWASSGPLFPELRPHLCCPPPAVRLASVGGCQEAEGSGRRAAPLPAKPRTSGSRTGICFIGAAHVTHRAISARTMRSHS